MDSGSQWRLWPRIHWLVPGASAYGEFKYESIAAAPKAIDPIRNSSGKGIEREREGRIAASEIHLMCAFRLQYRLVDLLCWSRFVEYVCPENRRGFVQYPQSQLISRVSAVPN